MSLKSSFFAEKYSSKRHKILCEIVLQKIKINFQSQVKGNLFFKDSKPELAF